MRISLVAYAVLLAAVACGVVGTELVDTEATVQSRVASTVEAGTRFSQATQEALVDLVEGQSRQAVSPTPQSTQRPTATPSPIPTPTQVPVDFASEIDRLNDLVAGLQREDQQVVEPTNTPRPSPTPRPTPTPRPEEVELFNLLARSIFQIEADQGLGTGFLIDDAGTLLTNAHVVGFDSRPNVILQSSNGSSK